MKQRTLIRLRARFVFVFLERAYFQYVYKTRPCAGFPYSCSCDGLDAHRPEESRRGPIITYMPMACPNVKPYLNAEWARPNIDCSGRFKPKVLNKNGQLVPQESDQWDCEYAHTLLELMYHPQVYKVSYCTQLCVKRNFFFEPASTFVFQCLMLLVFCCCFRVCTCRLDCAIISTRMILLRGVACGSVVARIRTDGTTCARRKKRRKDGDNISWRHCRSRTTRNCPRCSTDCWPLEGPRSTRWPVGAARVARAAMPRPRRRTIAACRPRKEAAALGDRCARAA
jgi:hypothetical protein